MELLSQTCPNCQMDLSKIRDVIEDESLTFCLKCQFPLVLIAGKYRLESVLRKGGCSIVYVARHVHLDRDAERVIKIIRPEFFTIKGMATRFRREVQLTSALSQRNEHIVRIFDDFGEIPNIGHFYVMEYLQGSPLSSMLKDPALLPSLSFCYHLFMQLCEAMQFAHEQGVVHRDLKPDNLVLVKRKKDPYFLKVLDFGIAKPLSSEELPGTHVTQGSLGTPAYMAPEQCLNQPTDARTDLYAMGIILYELLTGRTPFLPPQGEHSAYTSVVGVIEGQITTLPPSPHELRPDRVSASMEKMLLKALAKKPADRYQSIDDFRDAFVAEVASTPAFTKEGGSYSMDRGEAPKAFPMQREGLSTAELELVFANPDAAIETPPPADDEAEATLMYGGPAQEPVLMLSPSQKTGSPSDETESPQSDEEDAVVKLAEMSLDEDDDPALLLALKATRDEEQPLLLTQPKQTPAPLSVAPEHEASPTTEMPASTEPLWADSGDVSPAEATAPKEPLWAELEEASPVDSTVVLAGGIDGVDARSSIRDDRGSAATETLMYSQRQAKEALDDNADAKAIPAEADAPRATEDSRPAPDDNENKALKTTAAYSSLSAKPIALLDATEFLSGNDGAKTLADADAVPPVSKDEDAKKTPTQTPKPLDRASLMGLIDRVQGPRDGRVGFFLIQHKPWDTDPFLVKSIRDKISRLQAFLKSKDFQSLYPGCRGKIIVEASVFPQEVAKQLMREFVELRLKPRTETPTPASAPTNGTASRPAQTKQTPAPTNGQPTKPTAPKPTNQTPTPARTSQPAGALQVSAKAEVETPPPKAPAKAPASPVQGTPVPSEQDLPKGPTPMAIWDRLDETEPVYLAPQRTMSPGMMGAAAVLLVSLVGIVYALLGMGSIPDPAQNMRILEPGQVSAATQPKVSYARVSLRPDRATFALIPVQDRRSGTTEVFVLFASRENRRLLVYAPQSQSQILARLKQKAGSEQVTPVWQRDLQGQGRSPEVRTYTGTLEHLQRRKNGPLELVLPDENRNINKIPGFVQAGIQFPMDSMILLVGQKPKPPPHHHGTVLWMALLSALASGAVFFSLQKRQQRAF